MLHYIFLYLAVFSPVFRYSGSKANSHNEQRLSTPDENQAVPDFKSLKKKALTILKERLGKKVLTKEQREEVKKVISDADRGVAEDILKMTGVRTEGLSTTEMTELVAERKKRGDFSWKEEGQIDKLESDLQVLHSLCKRMKVKF